MVHSWAFGLLTTNDTYVIVSFENGYPKSQPFCACIKRFICLSTFRDILSPRFESTLTWTEEFFNRHTTSAFVCDVSH